MTNSQSDSIFGHDAAIAQFTAAYASGRLHHAWLITGTGQIGKTSLARSFAKILLKASNPNSGAARRIAAGTHRDLLYVKHVKPTSKTSDSTTIVVADIKPISQLLHHTAAEGGWRVVIVEGGDLLNSFAGNAILKLLEEPPEKTVFFIIADNESAVLPTIRSRCHKLRLRPLDDDAMCRFFDSIGILEPDLRQELLNRAKGRPGHVVQHAASNDDGISQCVAQVIKDGPRCLTPEQAERIAREERGFARFCDLLQENLRDRALNHSRSDNLNAASRAADAYQALTRLRHETERFNLDKTQAALMAVTLLDKL